MRIVLGDAAPVFVELREDIHPGEYAHLVGTVPAPRSPGEYALRVELVTEATDGQSERTTVLRESIVRVGESVGGGSLSRSERGGAG